MKAYGKLVGTILSFAIGSLSAQIRDPAAPAFDVASVKESRLAKTGGEGSSRSRIEHSPTGLTMRNVSLTDCVMWAYRLDSFQVSVPGSLDSKAYDILAKISEPVPVSQLRLMLRQLLAERFKLNVHRDTKTLPVYALNVAKGGPKLPPALIDGDSHHIVERLPRVEDGSFLFPESSMAEFAAKLSLLRGMDRPVMDQTGITGYFDITLKGAARAILDDGASLFTLVQEQLGLKLIPTKIEVEILIVDHAEKPTGN
jgi:uncharacterized protein (TIGR03435 family)